MPRTRRRRGARMRVRHTAFFEAEDCKGTATLCEISYSGARFLSVAIPPEGASVHLYIWPLGQAEPLELLGTVVGQRQDGFAVEYENAGQQTCQSVDILRATTPKEELGQQA